MDASPGGDDRGLFQKGVVLWVRLGSDLRARYAHMFSGL